MFNVCENIACICIYICYKLQSQFTLNAVHVFFKNISRNIQENVENIKQKYFDQFAYRLFNKSCSAQCLYVEITVR